MISNARIADAMLAIQENRISQYAFTGTALVFVVYRAYISHFVSNSKYGILKEKIRTHSVTCSFVAIACHVSDSMEYGRLM